MSKRSRSSARRTKAKREKEREREREILKGNRHAPHINVGWCNREGWVGETQANERIYHGV